MVFPQNRLSDRFDSQSGKSFEIVEPCGVAAALKLFEVLIADTVDRAFHSAPQLKSGVLILVSFVWSQVAVLGWSALNRGNKLTPQVPR